MTEFIVKEFCLFNAKDSDYKAKVNELLAVADNGGQLKVYLGSSTWCNPTLAMLLHYARQDRTDFVNGTAYTKYMVRVNSEFDFDKYNMNSERTGGKVEANQFKLYAYIRLSDEWLEQEQRKATEKEKAAKK